MKRKNLLITLICILCSCIAGFLVCSCSNAGLKDGNGSGEITFTGLTVKDEVTCNAGELVSLEIPIVRDQNGDLLDVFTSVVDSSGAFVEVKGGGFFATDGGGYTITYSIYTADKNVHSVRTTVHVIGNYYITLDMDRVVWQGDKVKFSFSHKLSNPTFAYSVKYNGTDVAVGTDNSFTCENGGFYDCTITAVDDYHSAEAPMKYSFKVYAYTESEYQHFGLVEGFDKNWETIREISGFGRQGWSLTDSATTGVKDHNGVDSYFATTEMAVGMNFNNFYLNPLYGSEYYNSLIAEGYKNVEVWIYIDGPSRYYVENFMTDSTSYEYTRSLGYISPYRWTKISIPLQGGEKTWSKSFVECVDNYKSQIVNFLKFSNGDQKVSSKIYLSDIYAVKTADAIETKATFNVPVVGDTYNFNDMFEVSALDYTATYNVTSDHGVSKTLKQGETYQFTSNGCYTVTAIPSRPDYVTTNVSTVTFDVNDEVSLIDSYKSFERVNDTYDVYMQSIQVGANPVTGLDVSIRYKGEELDISPTIVDPKGNSISYDEGDGYFTVSKDGKYTLYYTADYEISGVPCKTYKEYSFDVWSQATKYIMGLTEDMAVCRLDSDNTPSVGESANVVAGGISGNKFVITPNTTGAIVAIKPLFSKNYYKALMAEMKAADPEVNLEAIIEAYIEGKIGAIRTFKTSTATVDKELHNINDYPVGYYTGTSWLDYKRAYFYDSQSGENKWCNTTITLDSFIDVYDMLVSNYENVSAKTNINSGYSTYRFNAYDYYSAFWTVTKGTHVYFTDLELSLGKVNYNVETYIETGTNTNTYTYSTERFVAKTGATVSANVLVPDGYYYDAENENAITSATVKADGSTTLKLYYRRLPLYRVEYYTRAQKGDGTFADAVLQSNRTQYVYASAGSNAVADTTVTFPYCNFNAALSTYQAVVPNNDTLVLKLYYDSYAKDLGLLDTSTGENTFDIGNYLQRSGSEYSYTLWQLYSNGLEFPISGASAYISATGVVNYESLEGMFVIKATPKAGGNVEVVKFEAYNENEYTWNSVTTQNIDAITYSYLPQLLDAHNEVSVKKIGTKNYFEFNVNYGSYRSFSLLPAHSVEYYDRLRGKGIELSFRFKREGTSGWSQFFSFSTDNANDSYGKVSGTWYTVSLSIEDIVDKYWNAIFDPSCLMTSWNERGLCGMMVVIPGDKNTVTVGDFTIRKTFEFDLSKEDSSSLTEYNLSKWMSPTTIARINELVGNGYTITAAITSAGGTAIDVPDYTNFDLSSLSKAYYEFNVYAEKGTVKDVMYSAGIEIFDSTEGLVFNTVSTDNLGYITAHYFADNVTDISVDGDSFKIVYPTAPKKNTFRSFQILPIHSKTYYQKYYDKDLLFSFDINFTTVSGEYDGSVITPDTSITYQQFKDKQYHKQIGLNYLHTVYIRLNDILDNWSAYNLFANTDSRTGATVRTIGNGAGILTITISNIKLSQPYDGEETSANYLKGKKVAVIGDSISTWVDGFYASSYYPIASAKYGEDFVRSDMWWQKVADNFGMNVTRNNSVSGRTTASKGNLSYGVLAGTDLAYERNDNITPDYVFIFLGTNDRGQEVPMGTVTEGLYETVAAYTPEVVNGSVTNKITDFATAYARLIYDVQRTYTGAKIYCLNVPSLSGESKTPEMNGIISSIATHYGAEVVDLYTAFGENYKVNTLDGLHPNKAGQNIMANALIAKLNGDYHG